MSVNQEKAAKIVKDFAKEFPRSSETLAPRSLKHLSRLEVRKSLAEVKTLPKGVFELHIPRNLQHYLLLQDSKEQFFPEFVSKIFPKENV
jgi:hypothetical protein